jgi:hypothetical protein
LPDRIVGQLHIVEEIISKLDDIAIETMQNEKLKKTTNTRRKSKATC